MPGHDYNTFFDFGQLIGRGLNWLLGKDKLISTGKLSNATTQSTTSNIESNETLKYRMTTGKGSRYGNVILPEFKVKDTVVPEGKASEIYKKLNEKFQDDWEKQVKKDN